MAVNPSNNLFPSLVVVLNRGLAASDPSSLASPGFEAVMARLSPANRAAVIETIQTVDISLVDELVTALRMAELSASIFNDPDLTLYSHAALFSGQITSLQFATLQRFSMALERRGAGAEYQVHHLFDKRGEVNSTTLGLLRKTWSENLLNKKIFEGQQRTQELLGGGSKTSAEMNKVLNNQCDLNEDQEKIFLTLIQELPPSERQVILMEDLEPETASYDSVIETGSLPKGQTISQAVNQETGVNVFCRVEHDSSPKRIIASTGIMQAYLIASDRAVQINPVVGLSDRSDIHRGLVEGYHDMSLAGIPEVTEALPATADGYIAAGEDFPWHDFYHCIRQGEIPIAHKEMHMSIADVLLGDIRRTEGLTAAGGITVPYNAAVERLYEAIIDAEYPMYAPRGVVETPESAKGTQANLLFWGTLQRTIGKSTIIQAVKDGSLTLAAQYTQEYVEGPACELVAKAILINREVWAANGVTLEEFFRIADETQKNVDRIFEQMIREENIDLSDRQLLEVKKQIEWGTGSLPLAAKLRELLESQLLT